MRGRLILLTAGVLVAVGAGCVTAPPPPPPPTQICSQSFTGPSQYQASYQNLGHAGLDWVTADGFVPVPLPDGTTSWWMSDTMTGTANPDNSVSNVGNVHNSLVRQAASCLTPSFTPFPGQGSAWHWPGSGVVSGNTLRVFGYKVVQANGQPGFDWNVVGVSVASYALPSLQYQGTTALPVNNAPNGGQLVPWGTRSFLNPTDGKIYMYGTTKFSAGPFPAAETWLARAAVQFADEPGVLHQPAPPDRSLLERNFADAKPMTFTKNLLPGDAPLAQLSVVPYGSRFLASAFEADVFQDQQGRSFVRAWVADTPQGPWQMVVDGTGQPQTIATFQRQTADQIAYHARVAQLPGAGWAVVYSVNDPLHQQQNLTLYRGQFAAPSGLPAP